MSLAAVLLILAAVVASMAALVWLLLHARRSRAAREMAEKAAAQERNLLWNLIEAIPDQISVKDLEGRFVINNQASRKFLEVSKSTGMEGKTVYDFFNPEMANRFYEEDRQVLESQEPILAQEEPALTSEGKLAWFSTTKLPLKNLDGELCGLICIHTDITARKAAEEKLRVFGTQLEQSNMELRDFAGVASHDLQEPLRKIQAFADRLRVKHGQALGPEGLDPLERIQNAANRMQTLIQDLLVLSRISSKEVHFQPVDLAQIIGEVQSDLEFRISQTGAKIEVGALPTINADPFQMRQMFQNLLSNALKFQKPGQRPEVIIQGKLLRVQDYQLPGAGPGDEVARIMVTDNGIGFPEQYVEQIFTLFARLHSREEFEGTGMGLAVCRKIAQRHGGSIVAKSTHGEGATFIIMLPVKQKIHSIDEGGG